ncbi:TPA: cupin domain-containing protein [Salmonella enterica subsp. diarizonae serovar 61:l,v:z35]
MDIKTWLAQQAQSATSVFHMGRYCEDWKATTYHTGKPSFHLVLDGGCWLQMRGSKKNMLLSEGDIVFFFSDLPFYFVSSPESRPEDLPLKKCVHCMIPLKMTPPCCAAFCTPVRGKANYFLR